MSPKPDSLSPLPACAPGTLPTRTDVLIIGGGLAGLSAALEAAGMALTRDLADIVISLVNEFLGST